MYADDNTVTSHGTTVPVVKEKAETAHVSIKCETDLKSQSDESALYMMINFNILYTVFCRNKTIRRVMNM